MKPSPDHLVGHKYVYLIQPYYTNEGDSTEFCASLFFFSLFVKTGL